jgi:transcriptional regulator with XRE-family HTH domain
MNNEPEQTIATRLKNIMKERRLRQVEISKAIGASRGTVSKWLSDTAQPSHEYLLRLAEVLKVPADWIIEGDDYYASYDDLDDMVYAVKETNRDMYLQELKLKNNIPYSIRYLEELYGDMKFRELEELEEKHNKSLSHFYDYEFDDASLKDSEIESIENYGNESKISHNILTKFAMKAGADISKTIYYSLEDDRMSPVMYRRAECAVDTSKLKIKNGKIYYFKHGLIYRTNILYNLPDGGLLIRSINDNFEDEVVSAKDINVIDIIGWVYSWTNLDVW